VDSLHSIAAYWRERQTIQSIMGFHVDWRVSPSRSEQSVSSRPPAGVWDGTVIALSCWLMLCAVVSTWDVTWWVLKCCSDIQSTPYASPRCRSSRIQSSALREQLRSLPHSACQMVRSTWRSALALSSLSSKPSRDDRVGWLAGWKERRERCALGSGGRRMVPRVQQRGTERARWQSSR
jgi:hypothetical protein